MRIENFEKKSIGVLGLAAICLAGCGGSTSNWQTRTVQQSKLDACYDVRLEHRSGKRSEFFKADDQFEEIVVVLTPRATQNQEYKLKHANADQWPSWSAFNLEEVEIRADASRQRVWFVDRKSGKVAGSIDRKTGATTGPGDTPPDWATATGGERLTGN